MIDQLIVSRSQNFHVRVWLCVTNQLSIYWTLMHSRDNIVFEPIDLKYMGYVPSVVPARVYTARRKPLNSNGVVSCLFWGWHHHRKSESHKIFVCAKCMLTTAHAQIGGDKRRRPSKLPGGNLRLTNLLLLTLRNERKFFFTKGAIVAYQGFLNTLSLFQ